MAREKKFRRLSKFWWILAFTLGTALGALASALLNVQNALWIALFLVVISGAVMIFEQLGEGGVRSLRSAASPPRWRGRPLLNHPSPQRMQAHRKQPVRRAQLHAITGKKKAEPPSSGTS